MNKLALAAALAATASLFAAVPAAAETVTVRIDYSDINLATAAGTQALGQRIEANAEAVCGRAFIRDLKGVAATAKCKQEVVAGALAQLGAKGVDLPAHD